MFQRYKSPEKRNLIFILLAVLVLSALVAVLHGQRRVLSVDGKEKTDLGGIERCRIFLSSFGWETPEEPVEIRTVAIPAAFNATYLRYNEIQLENGFDLREYQGKTVVKYVFQVLNYPGLKNDDSIYATCLVYHGNIIGGDVCSVKIDGFMHGFQREQTNEQNQTG